METLTKKQTQSSKNEFYHSKKVSTEKFEIYSPLNPTYQLNNNSGPVGCPKCQVQCTGCTGSCTCFGGVVH